jgi:hypothetical protein
MEHLLDGGISSNFFSRGASLCPRASRMQQTLSAASLI